MACMLKIRKKEAEKEQNKKKCPYLCIGNRIKLTLKQNIHYETDN